MDYKCKRWKLTRQRVLRRDGYMCQLSLRYGKHVPADTVHHIFPASEYPEYQWCEWNLISLNHSVHNTLHYRDSDKLTEEGERLRQRVARMKNIPIE